jgi:hypothetical protein
MSVYSNKYNAACNKCYKQYQIKVTKQVLENTICAYEMPKSDTQACRIMYSIKKIWLETTNNSDYEMHYYEFWK